MAKRVFYKINDFPIIHVRYNIHNFTRHYIDVIYYTISRKVENRIKDYIRRNYRNSPIRAYKNENVSCYDGLI